MSIVLTALLAAAAGGCAEEDPIVRIDDKPHAIFTIADERIVAELTLDVESRTRGMSYRDSFPDITGYDGTGMLFVFPQPEILGFWMKDCLIDIDLIFLDARGTVTAVHRMPIEPARRPEESQQAYENRLPVYPSRVPAQFAIELPAGSIDRLNVRVDQRIDLPLERLKAMAE